MPNGSSFNWVHVTQIAALNSASTMNVLYDFTIHVLQYVEMAIHTRSHHYNAGTIFLDSIKWSRLCNFNVRHKTTLSGNLIIYFRCIYIWMEWYTNGTSIELVSVAATSFKRQFGFIIQMLSSSRPLSNSRNHSFLLQREAIQSVSIKTILFALNIDITILKLILLGPHRIVASSREHNSNRKITFRQWRQDEPTI